MTSFHPLTINNCIWPNITHTHFHKACDFLSLVGWFWYSNTGKTRRFWKVQPTILLCIKSAASPKMSQFLGQREYIWLYVIYNVKKHFLEKVGIFLYWEVSQLVIYFIMVQNVFGSVISTRCHDLKIKRIRLVSNINVLHLAQTPVDSSNEIHCPSCTVMNSMPLVFHIIWKLTLGWLLTGLCFLWCVKINMLQLDTIFIC